MPSKNEKLIDKSDGSGCIRCSFGSTCKGCIHKDDIVNNEKRISEERANKNKKGY